MLVKRLTLAAGVETAFEFDEYAANSVVVKNETSGEILFCDGPFDATRAAHIPAFTWQGLNVRVFPGEKPKFYVKAAAAGVVEIDFGSSGMGVLGNVKLSGSIIPDTQPVPVNMVTSLSSDYDTVNVNKMGKGSVTTIHSAITTTATSAEIDCRGYNAILISAEISAEFNWTFKVQGCMASGGTFVDCYEQANTGAMVAMSYQTNASKMFLFKGIPDYIKIVATEDADGATVTVKVQPLNV